MPRVLNWLTALLFAASVLLRSPMLFLVAVLLTLIVVVTAVWGRYALAGVTYRRRLGTARLFVGEETDLWIEIANAKPLPLPWLKANDEFPTEMELLTGELHYSEKETRRLLTNLVSLRFYERVRKHYRLRARQRGALEFGPVEITSGDMFGVRSRSEFLQQVDTLIVYPKVAPISALNLESMHPFGDVSTRRRISDDPLRLMGVRAYVAGDSPRLIHWKATARRAGLQTKVFEPGAAESTAIFIDVQTVPYGFQGYVPEYLELAITAAASLARYLLDSRELVGLYANGVRRHDFDLVRLPPSRRPAHWFEILDTLARLNMLPSLELDRYLRAEATALAFGTTVVVISAVVTEDLAGTLLDLKRQGHPVTLLAIGEEAPANVPNELSMFWLGGVDAYGKLVELDLGNR